MAFPGSAPQPRAGYVVFPSSLIGHEALKDMDYPVLLLLDQIGWREGDRDGRVRATNAELATRLRKKERAVQASIGRIESIRPTLIVRSVADRNARIIQLQYDRYGADPLDAPPTLTIVPAEERTELRGGMHRIAGGVCTDLHPPPIRELDVVGGVVVGVRTELHTSQTSTEAEVVASGTPTTLADLVAWLPALTEDPAVVETLSRKVRLWLPRLRERSFVASKAEAIDWIQDALIRASDKEDLASYAQWLLGAWVKAGGRPEPELRSSQSPDPEPGAVAAPRKTAAEKRAALIAGFDIFREDADGTAE